MHTAVGCCVGDGVGDGVGSEVVGATLGLDDGADVGATLGTAVGGAVHVPHKAGQSACTKTLPTPPSLQLSMSKMVVHAAGSGRLLHFGT